jgi:hypothetical protein
MALQVRPKGVTLMLAGRARKAAASGASCIASQEGAVVVTGFARSLWLNIPTGRELPRPSRVQMLLDPSV